MKELKLFRRGTAKTLISLYAESIHAGFKIPVADYEEEKIDFNAYVTRYPAATFFCKGGRRVYDRIRDFSGRHFGGRPVDDAKSGDIVVGIIDNEQGRNTVIHGSMGFEKKWAMRQEFLSRRYTTQMEDIIIVNAI